MRKGALLLALVIVAAAPSAALAASKKSAAPANPNAAGQKFVTAAFMQPYYAWQSMWTPKAAAPKKKR